MYPLEHKTGTPDLRYKIALEYCGFGAPMYVVRFVEQWVGSAETEEDAIAIAKLHNKVRMEYQENE